MKQNDKAGWGISFSLEEIPRPVYKFDPEGMFVLLATIDDDRILTDTDILVGYKGRNVVEISFNWLKGDAVVAPVFLKKMTRIHSLGFVFVVWMLIYSLIQRELRRALKFTFGNPSWNGSWSCLAIRFCTTNIHSVHLFRVGNVG